MTRPQPYHLADKWSHVHQARLRVQHTCDSSPHFWRSNPPLYPPTFCEASPTSFPTFCGEFPTFPAGSPDCCRESGQSRESAILQAFSTNPADQFHHFVGDSQLLPQEVGDSPGMAKVRNPPRYCRRTENSHVWCNMQAKQVLRTRYGIPTFGIP